jgi:hypothetical protein
MSSAINNPTQPAWQPWQKAIFRVLFIYFLVQVIPVDWKFYRELFSVNWFRLHYGDIFNLAHYTPDFTGSGQSFVNWIIALFIALPGAALWTYFAKNKETNFNKLYYWLRVVLRYRLAIALLAYGFIKFFPLQAPYPSISNLNTNYGDFNRWKLFSLSLGIVPSYESFLGAVEIVLAAGLLYRKTASIAAFIVIVFTGNVVMSNIAYDGGEYIYSLFLVSLAAAILLFDLQRIVRLLILQKPTAPNRFHPVFTTVRQRYTRWVLKIAFFLFFIVIYGFKTRSGYQHDTYQYPVTKGLPGLKGLYNVSTFILNKDSLAYSRTDSIRWRDVVFENWNTISIRSNRPVIIDTINTDRIIKDGSNRTYELEGSAGRHYYSYSADTVNHLLTLNNRNPHYKDEMLVFKYSIPDDSTIVLAGLNQHKDSVFTRLEKVNKKYLLQVVAKEGRRKSLKL